MVIWPVLNVAIDGAREQSRNFKCFKIHHDIDIWHEAALVWWENERFDQFYQMPTRCRTRLLIRKTSMSRISILKDKILASVGSELWRGPPRRTSEDNEEPSSRTSIFDKKRIRYYIEITFMGSSTKNTNNESGSKSLNIFPAELVLFLSKIKS